MSRTEAGDTTSVLVPDKRLINVELPPDNLSPAREQEPRWASPPGEAFALRAEIYHRLLCAGPDQNLVAGEREAAVTLVSA